MEKRKTFIYQYKWIFLSVQLLICGCIFITIYFTQKGIYDVNMANADMIGGYVQDDGSIYIDEEDGAYGLYLNVYTDEIKSI